MTKRTKLSIFVITLLLIIGTAGAVAATRREKPVDVRIESVEPRDLIASVTASGKVSASRVFIVAR